jgi:diguanylate cyclase (GGDEF)-like protein
MTLQEPHHGLLRRQLEKVGLGADAAPTPEQWSELLDGVDRAYKDADRGRQLMERALEVSSRELGSMYEGLQVASDHRVASERNRLQLVFDSVNTALIVVEGTGRIAAANPEACRLFGEGESIIDRQLLDTVQLVGRDGAPRALFANQGIEDILSLGRWTRNDVRLVSESAPDHVVRGDIAVVPFDTDDSCLGGLVIVTDNAEREAARERLAWQASHDPLTGLANRSMVTEKIELALVQARRSNAWPSLVLLDLDRFKHVNDSFGHAAGDRLLTLAAERLLGCVRSIDTVARLGGDEFVILVEAAGDTGLVRSLADRVLAAVAEPFELSGEATHVTGSIGIAHSGPMYNSAEALLHDADLAMYRAKERGRNCYDVADDRLRVTAAERVLLERGLRSAIAKQELGVAYQPVRRAGSDDLVGFEALARWVHPVLGDVRPDRFVPVAEEAGLIQALGDRMLDVACRDVAIWNGERLAAGLEPLVVHVNVSVRDLQSPNLLERVQDPLTRHGVPAEWLVLEMTESMLLDDPDKALERLEELKAAGVRVAIDDFGTGYSSLAYLRRYPVHMVKIDREFVSEIASSTQNQCIVKAMVDLAQGLEYVVLAEGVETSAELDALRELGCDLVQGFLIGRPVPPEDALALATSALSADEVSSRTGSPDPSPSASDGTEHLQPQP